MKIVTEQVHPTVIILNQFRNRNTPHFLVILDQNQYKHVYLKKVLPRPRGQGTIVLLSYYCHTLKAKLTAQSKVFSCPPFQGSPLGHQTVSPLSACNIHYS